MEISDFTFKIVKFNKDFKIVSNLWNIIIIKIHKMKGRIFMKKTKKMVSIMIMVVMILFTMSAFVRVSASVVDTVIGQMGDIDGSQATGVAEIGGQIANILTTVGIVVAVVVLLILGIKYMMGSASEKAEYKKTMIPYLVGALLVLGASSIVKIVFSTINFSDTETVNVQDY